MLLNVHFNEAQIQTLIAVTSILCLRLYSNNLIFRIITACFLKHLVFLEKAHNEEQEILLDATQRRQGIITKAHQQAKELIEQEEIYKQAQQKAEALLTKAQSSIDAAYQSVERQIDYIFDSAESVLAQQQNQIRSSKNNILRILENPQNESELDAGE